MKGLLTDSDGVDCQPALFSYRVANSSSIRVPTNGHACFFTSSILAQLKEPFVLLTTLHKEKWLYLYLSIKSLALASPNSFALFKVSSPSFFCLFCTWANPLMR